MALPTIPSNPELAVLRAINETLAQRLDEAERAKREKEQDNKEWEKFAFTLVEEMSKLQVLEKEGTPNVDALLEQLDPNVDPMSNEGLTPESAMGRLQRVQTQQMMAAFASELMSDPTARRVRVLALDVVGVEYVGSKVADMVNAQLKALGWVAHAQLEGLDDTRSMLVTITKRPETTDFMS